ncbi:putative glutaredoxin-like, plant II, Thioredoxin-like superfamily [Dioscorea sansibarensis]
MGKRGYCMSHITNRLLQGFGANMTICEINERLPKEMAYMDEIREMYIGNAKMLAAPLFPMVFFRGKLVRGLDRLTASHIPGELVAILQRVGALWL